jgi:Holliday junction resolvase RusA-like endonuclease
MQISFTVPGEPQGKARAKTYKNHGITRTVTPENTVLYENMIKVMYRQKCGNCIKFEGPLKIDITAYYGIPESKSKKVKFAMQMGTLRPTKKPDADNVMKVVCDALNEVAYKDDAAIVEATFKKYYSYEPRVEITLTSVT